MDYPVNDSDYNSNQKPNSISYPMEGPQLRAQEIPSSLIICNEILGELNLTREKIEIILAPIEEVDLEEADREMGTTLHETLIQILQKVRTINYQIKL